MNMPNRKFAFLGKLLLAAVVATLAGCAPVQERADADKPRLLIYPPPPDEPRYAYERTIYGSADVTPRKNDAALKRALTGELERSEGLVKPYAVAVHRGRIFVSDSADRFVKVFDVPEGRYFKIGDDDLGPLTKPLGIDVDSQGNLYVADGTARAIMVYTRDGKFLRKIGGPKVFERLSSVTVDAPGQRVFVTDIGGVSSDQHKVRVFDSNTGAHLFDLGKRGIGPGEFNLPRDVAIGVNGQIYVVDGGNFRVQVFDRTGRYLNSFGSVGKQMGNFARPKEIATDASGNVYVVDAAFGNFQIFNAEGDLLMFIGERSETDGPARYMLPSGIYVDEDGRVYMVDQWFKKIDVYRPHALGADTGFLAKRAPVK
ncbi:6-bladed beta-propeller [uncultured Dechloromonas sp.]|uniref:6-bladed beta-propeller n=1 Tax=uncultured Dechloromonas sp. TaxID=171719 RepID=UPI0025FA2ABC|nr:6-bladed beta-propeller [uncultured Dechloromonas sp.]